MSQLSNTVPVRDIYEVFFTIITDDFYVNVPEKIGEEDLLKLLKIAIPQYQFPRHPINLVEEFNSQIQENEYFVEGIAEHIDCLILAQLMSISWLRRQIASIEVLRQKVSGQDFKITSQASHLQKMLLLKTDLESENWKLQRLENRRYKDERSGRFESSYKNLNHHDEKLKAGGRYE